MNKNILFAKKKYLKRKRAQGLIEFVLTLVAFLTIAFMFVQLALGMGVANYVQYATFLASRAYMAGARSQEAQTNAAVTTLDRMLYKGGEDRFKSIIKAVETDGLTPLKGAMIGGPRITKSTVAETRLKNWEQGVTYKFKARLYMLPFIKVSDSPGGGYVELESQSWLGREPSFNECMDYMNKKTGPMGSLRSQITGAFLIDNGC